MSFIFRYSKNSAGADGGPRFQVCVHLTLCSAPHQHQWNCFSSCVNMSYCHYRCFFNEIPHNLVQITSYIHKPPAYIEAYGVYLSPLDYVPSPPLVDQILPRLGVFFFWHVKLLMRCCPTIPVCQLIGSLSRVCTTG